MRAIRTCIASAIALLFLVDAAPAQDHLTLVSPNGGEEWILGETGLLHFETSLAHPFLVDIDISRDGGATWESLYDDLEAQTNQGQMPVTGPASDTCLLRVATSDGVLSDVSDATFRIIDTTPQSGLAWAAPAAGDTLVNGATVDLSWTWTLVDLVDVDIRRAGDPDWTSLLDGIVCDGAEAVIPDLPEAGDYELRISDAGGSGASDTVGPLVVLNPAPVLQIPAAGTAWTVGSTCPIGWSAPGYATVDVEISRDAGATWTTLLSGLVNDGGENWPVSGPMSDHVMMRLRGDASGQTGGTSGTFAVFDPSALQVDETTLDFGVCFYDNATGMWEPAMRNFEVSNSAADTLFFIPVLFSGEIELEMTPGFMQKQRIPPGGSLEFSVSGAPRMPGTIEGEIAFFARMVEDDHYASSISMSALGTAPPTVDVQPNVLDLLDVPAGQVVDTEVTVTNTTDVYTTLDGHIALGWPNPNFSIVSGGGDYSLALGETWTFTVRCAPVEAGWLSTSIDLGLGDVFGGEPVEFMAMTEATFEETLVGSSDSDTLYFDNSGSDPLTGVVELSGSAKAAAGDCDAFSIAEGAGYFEIQPGERLAVVVDFAPMSAGVWNCSVSNGTASCPMSAVSTGTATVASVACAASADAFVDDDGTLFSDGPDQHALDVGFRDWGATKEYRGAVAFDVPAWLDGAPVTGATLRLYYFDAWGSFDARDVAVHRFTQGWSESTLWWYPAHEAAGSVASVGGAPGRWIEWDVTPQVSDWIEEGAGNFGFALIAAAGGSVDNAFRFASRQHSDPTFHPELLIDYLDVAQANLRPAAPAGWSDRIVVAGQAGTQVDGPVFPGQSVHISCAAENAGSRGAGAHTTRLSVDGATLTDAPSPGLAAGEQTVILDQAHTFPAVGAYTLRVETDVLGEVGESDEADNVYERVIDVADPAWPNLRPATPAGWTAPLVVGFDPATQADQVVYPGETGYVRWAFENAGATDAGAHTGRVSVDGIPWRDYPVAGAIAGELTSLDAEPLVFDHAGPHLLRLEVDADGDVAETWEPDNVYERTFEVTPGGQAAATYLDYMQGATSSGDLITTAATVSLEAHSTYYCALSWTGAAGPNGGYTGMQSHPDGDLFIFSVWDPDPATPTALEWRAADTQAVRYDNEGSGWATKAVYPWVVGDVYRFYVVAYDRGGRTCISHYVHDVTNDVWKHLAVLSYPYPGHWFRATASFLEDFSPINGEHARHFDLADGWKRAESDGGWLPWDEARFNYSLALSPNENPHLDADRDGANIRMESGGHTVHDTPRYTTFSRDMPASPSLPGGVLTSLEIVGPGSIEAGGAAEFTCTATWDDASQSDVTALTTWFAEAPGSFVGTELDAGSAAVGDAITITAQADILSTDVAAVLAVPVVGPTGTDPGGEIPHRASLERNRPNPFNPSTSIRFSLPEAADVRLRVFDVSGRLVATLVDGVGLEAGIHARTWSGVDESGQGVAAGVYFYRLEAVGFVRTRTMTLVK